MESIGSIPIMATMQYFASDAHFLHRNVIKYDNRPFDNVEQMTEQLILNWNSVVSNDDEVYYLGDFGLGSEDKLFNILQRLNGRIYYIFGNHDKVVKKSKRMLGRFIWAKELAEITIPDTDTPRGQKIVLCHYAMRVWNKSHHGAWHLYGHSHGSLPEDPNSLSFDVGMNCINYTPISYDQVKERMKNKDWKPIDHHS